MFKEITKEMKARMSVLEAMDAKDRADGTPRLQRLRQIPPETGKFIALTAVSAPEGEMIEIGTSAGYSTMWLSLAAMQKGVRLKTYEILPEKAALARETFALAGVEPFVELIEGDALEYLDKLGNVAFCFLDAEKEVYGKCWDIVSGKLVKGGILVADNAINHFATLQPMIEKSLADERFDAMVVPIGNGELVCRRK